MEDWLRGLVEEEKSHLYRLFYHSGKGRNMARGVVKQLKDIGLEEEKVDEVEDLWREVKDDVNKLAEEIGKESRERSLRKAFHLRAKIGSLINGVKNRLYGKLRDIEEDLRKEIDEADDKQKKEELNERLEEVEELTEKVARGELYNYIEKAKKDFGVRRSLLFSEVFTHFPSTLETLSMLFRTSVAVKGKHYTSIPSAPYLGEMVTALSQVLNTMEKAASGMNDRGNLNRQLGGVVRVFFNSNSFLTDVLARNVLIGLQGLWKREVWKEENLGEMSDTERVLYGILSNDNYPIGGVDYRWYKNHEKWPIKRRLEYFTGYWFVGEKDEKYEEEGEDLLAGLSENKEIDRDTLGDAVSNFRDRMRMEKGPKALIGAVMRHTFQKLLSKCYSKVTSQVQISAVRVGKADSMEELSLAITRLAYSQDAYKPESRLGILFSDAVREIRNTDKKMRIFDDKDPMDYTYNELIRELRNLAKPGNEQYECGHILKQIGDTGIDPKNRKKFFIEFQDLYSIVDEGIINKKGLLPHLRKKNAITILKDIKSGEVFEDLDVEGEKRERIKHRLGALIENGFLLVKHGEFKVMGVSREAQLLGMFLRMRALGMIEEKFDEDFKGESITWSLSKMQNLMQHASRERKKEIAREFSLEEAKNQVFRSVEEKSLSLLFSGKKSSGAEGQINEVRWLIAFKIVDESGKGNQKRLESS
ncbi:MAG: hypothetical protein GWO20_06495 [Candidatus Korarchaeota archaeon]|nr:hypothetical protein [Candidatus Korarchaeota archaeon]NIU83094.1 hypothetical protein [Candidatus Thorarchaeota archaeon]NIW13472.1 hypothetical protein [Candidatus Thorarchaeota archaeon]